MIFVTVGTQDPFDRLVRPVDAWCARHPDVPVVGQVIDPGPEGHRPRHFEWTSYMAPAVYRDTFARAKLIVGHAGMGSIITAMDLQKPIIVMPRRAALREQRNDHQYATAMRLGDRPGVYVALDEADLTARLDEALKTGFAMGGGAITPFAEDRLIAALRAEIHR
ncbi:glycosyltransferase [Roseospira navarrensis]|uniref:Glycosyl transferase family 28 n=1 Tax=Roseospira navarrensis TaxID=140058 RepID=A0A7X2D614_9PROT|nr:glycosyltransferase [Roseospira navarrensis]MQX38242.1 glycosyl transferase family 28 [Roseospira navarrensis]